ncbi:serine/threonine-protein kinase [Nonomuraea sp. B12E4]|uniref:serine/threonine-protein kinase n=1 Tax=Nonomuraea sp. B12E4 TaxID=3153564 RepID=UPI00325CF4E9
MRIIAGRYHLLAPLGEGGAGTVWRARDAVLHREVAVKELRLPADPARRERALTDALREARAAASLSHPAIITVHDVIVEQGQPWIVMDLLAGRSLGALVKERGRLPPGQVATVGLRMLDALEEAHRRGILHRDVKPGNVIVTDSGEAILTDFGIASRISDAPSTAAALSGAVQAGVAGSPGYIAPERLRGEPAGPASDLWSLGATLYTAVEGHNPYLRDSLMASIAAVITQPPPPVATGVPFAALLIAMLEKNPAARPHPQAIRAALQPIAVPLPARLPATAVVPAAGDATVPVAGRKTGSPVVLGGLAAATGAVVTAALLINPFDRTTTPPSPPPNRPIAQPTATVPRPPVSSPAATTTAPPQDGTFTTPPDACDLVTDDQASEIMPDAIKQDVGLSTTECDWIFRPSGNVNLRISHSADVPAARTVFTHGKQAQASKKGAGSVITYQAVRGLSGIGDEAFAQAWWETSSVGTHSIVWVRVRNLVIKIDSAAYSSSKQPPRQEDRAVKVARAVADTLGRLSSTGTG